MKGDGKDNINFFPPSRWSSRRLQCHLEAGCSCGVPGAMLLGGCGSASLFPLAPDASPFTRSTGLRDDPRNGRFCPGCPTASLLNHPVVVSQPAQPGFLLLPYSRCGRWGFHADSQVSGTGGRAVLSEGGCEWDGKTEPTRGTHTR